MNDDHDLEQRLRRLLPARVPGDLQRRLRAAEPPAHTASSHLPWPTFLAAWLRPWPLAYASLGAAWAAILVLHLLTQPPLPVTGNNFTQSSGEHANLAPATLTTGFSLDRAFLLTRNDNPDSVWP